VSDADLALFEGYQLGDLIGRDGVERTYEADLRGTPTVRNLEVDQAGEVLAEAGVLAGSAGNTVQLTLRSDVQEIAEQALAEGLQSARERGHPATAGSIVVLDPNTGDIVAMASLPTYDPAEFVGGISDEVWETWRSEGARNPLTNRAIQSYLPPASTFKLVTYIAGVEGGVVEPGTPVECKPALEFEGADGITFTKKNWAYPAHQGTLNLHEAFWQSCDIYFWDIALRVWRNREGVGTGPQVFPEDLIQQWARSLGFDEPTGIDLPHETGGVVGDREWFEPLFAAASRQVRSCDTPCPWSGGDVMDLSIGQGPLAVTPLQVAVAYAAAVNGGTVWVPHTVDRIVDPVSGQTVREVEPEVARILDISPGLIASIRADLHGVVTGGTATSTFAASNVADLAGGKTGTGQASGNRDDYAWFVGVAPWYDPQYVVAAVLEEGGHGGESAAPVVKVVLEYLMGREMTPVETGALTD
jgi:penicillin-binding protein 2